MEEEEKWSGKKRREERKPKVYLKRKTHRKKELIQSAVSDEILNISQYE